MKNFTSATQLLCSRINSPSDATLIEVLCKEKKFKKRFKEIIIRKMANIVVRDVFEEETLDDCGCDEADLYSAWAEIQDCGDR
jgi:hypothetical protein